MVPVRTVISRFYLRKDKLITRLKDSNQDQHKMMRTNDIEEFLFAMDCKLFQFFTVLIFKTIPIQIKSNRRRQG